MMSTPANAPFINAMMQPTRQVFAELDRLKATGQKLITEICNTGAQLFPNHFAPKPSATAVEFTLYGVKLLTRVELPLKDEEEPRLATYILDESIPPKLDRLLDYGFDKLGNVNRTMTIEDVAMRFVPDILRQLKSKNAVLLP